MHASLEVNIPNYAGAIVTTYEIVAAIAGPKHLNSVEEVKNEIDI